MFSVGRSVPVVLASAVLIGPASAQPAAAPPAAGERYYMTLFGTQSALYRTSHTHTWATFVRTAVTPTGEVPVAVDTVSWMPATLDIHPLRLRREPGVNLTLGQTLDWVASFNGKVSAWGPYEIDADRYSRFIARKNELESGAIEYRAIGALTRRGEVSNCGQSFARSSPIVGRRYLQPTPSPGENGTSKLAQRYLKVGALADDGATHPWLLPVMGADRYPITLRQPGERIPYSGRLSFWEQ
ncbi:MAG: hypothetical protein U0871_03935 [Gemmataceae bacterium]